MQSMIVGNFGSVVSVHFKSLNPIKAFSICAIFTLPKLNEPPKVGLSFSSGTHKRYIRVRKINDVFLNAYTNHPLTSSSRVTFLKKYIFYIRSN